MLKSLIKQKAMYTEVTIPKFWLNACKRCGGSQTMCHDRSGHYRKCLSCARTEDINPSHALQILRA